MVPLSKTTTKAKGCSKIKNESKINPSTNLHQSFQILMNLISRQIFFFFKNKRREKNSGDETFDETKKKLFEK